MKRTYLNAICVGACATGLACGHLGITTDAELVGDGDGDKLGDGDDGVGDGDIGDGDVGDGDNGLGGGPGDVFVRGTGGRSGTGGLFATGGSGTGGEGTVGEGTGGGSPTVDPSLPTCEITEPVEQSEIPFFGGISDSGEKTGIRFTAKAADLEDGELTGESIVWTFSGSNEPIGYGTSFVLPTLPSGENKVVCTVMDSDANAGVGYVHLTSLSPVVIINHPGLALEILRPVGVAIEFSAVGYDFEDGELNPETFYWDSSFDGDLGVGNAGYALSTVGEHLITVTAFDSDQNQATATVVVPVVASVDVDLQ